jgi:MFS family permease
VVIAGWLIFAGVYFAMARVTTQLGVWVAFAVYGAYYGMTEGVLKAYAVDLAPSHLRGTAVGAYYTFTGAALLPASLIAGYLWKQVNPSATFYFGSAMAIVAIILLALLPAEDRRSRQTGE